MLQYLLLNFAYLAIIIIITHLFITFLFLIHDDFYYRRRLEFDATLRRILTPRPFTMLSPSSPPKTNRIESLQNRLTRYFVNRCDRSELNELPGLKMDLRQKLLDARRPVEIWRSELKELCAISSAEEWYCDAFLRCVADVEDSCGDLIVFVGDVGGEKTEIDRRATIDAILSRLDEKKKFAADSSELLSVGFALAACFSLQPHMLFFWVRSGDSIVRPRNGTTIAAMVDFWITQIRKPSNLSLSVDYLFEWKPFVNADISLIALENLWPNAVPILHEVDGNSRSGSGSKKFSEKIAAPLRKHKWIHHLLRILVEDNVEYESVAEFVWSKLSDQDRRSAMYYDRGEFPILLETVRSGCYKMFLLIYAGLPSHERTAALDRLKREHDGDSGDGARLPFDDPIALTSTLWCSMIAGDTKIFLMLVESMDVGISELWQSVPHELLIEDFVKFIIPTVERGYLDAAEKMWTQLGFFDQARVVLGDDCRRVFHESCADGKFAIVEILWKWASREQRRSLINQYRCDPLLIAFRNAHLPVVEYLWRRMDPKSQHDALECFLADETVLRDFIIEAAPLNEFHLLESFLVDFSSPQSQLHDILNLIAFNALTWTEAAAWKAVLESAVAEDDDGGSKWTKIDRILNQFNEEQRFRLIEAMDDNRLPEIPDKAETITFTVPISYTKRLDTQANNGGGESCDQTVESASISSMMSASWSKVSSVVPSEFEIVEKDVDDWFIYDDDDGGDDSETQESEEEEDDIVVLA